MPLTSTVIMDVQTVFQGAEDFPSQQKATLKKMIELATGTGADQSDQLFADQRTVSASSTDSLDLSGTLTNYRGETITFARIKFIAIFAAAANGSTITLTAPATNGISTLFTAVGDGIKIGAGCPFLVGKKDATGYAVTAGTADLLDIVNDDGAASATYDIFIIGATA